VGSRPPPISDSGEYRLKGVLVRIPVLAEAASGLGFLNWMPDCDRVVASMPTPEPDVSPNAAIAAGGEIGEPVTGAAAGLCDVGRALAASRGSANFASLRRYRIEGEEPGR
jgi:hypothetical protein